MPIPKEDLKSDDNLISKVEAMSKDAVKFNKEFTTNNADLFDRYVGNEYGDEEAEKSKVMSNDVEDTVNAYMVSAARVFLGVDEVIAFKPRDKENEEDVAEAKQKTQYADWLIRGQEDSYSTQYGALLEILLMKFGVVKYFAEDTQQVVEEQYSGIDPEEMALFQESLEGEDVESVEIKDKSGDFNGVDKIELTFRVTKKKGKRVRVVGVPPECFLITKDAISKDTAPIVGDDTEISRGEIVGMGFKKEDVAKMPMSPSKAEGDTRLQEERDREQGSDTKPWNAPTWASEMVVLKTRYALIDVDGDGIAERRYILYSGKVLLVDEPFDHVPYAIGSSHLMPHRVIGRSVGEQAEPYARQNTALMRGMFDNAYAVNAPRIAHNELVNADDLYDQEHGGTIRVEGDKIPANQMQAIETPFIGDKTMLLLQYQSQRRAATTGAMLISQGLQADDLNQETAARFNGIRDEGQGKVELVVRNIAQTYFSDLYKGVIWIATHYQDSEQEIEVLGEKLLINPSGWKIDHALDVKVGLGAGDEDKVVENMTGVLSLQQRLKAEGSPLFDNQKEYNAISQLLKGISISNTSKYFNDPEQPNELILANNEKLIKILEQQQRQIEAMNHPITEAEIIRAKAKVKSDEEKTQLAIVQTMDKREQFEAKQAEEARQFDVQQQNDMQKHNDDVVVELTTLEIESGQDIPGSSV